MTQEPKAMPGKQMNQQNPATADTASTKDDEIAEVEKEISELDIPSNNGVFNKMEMVVEKLASNRVVQIMLEQCDRVLKIVEDTARWGLPQDENDAKLERPLPWIFFLSLIIWLRILYFWLNIASVIVGTPRVTAQSMVHALQVKRRRLRAIRMRGLKSARRGDEGPMTSAGSSGKPPSLTAKVTELFGRAVCRPGQMRDVPNRRECLSKDSSENQNERCSSKRPRDEETPDLNMTVDQMLDKYANDDSEEDSDYVPDAEIDDDNESSTSCTSSMSSDEETEKESVENIPTAENNSSSMDRSIVEIKENGAPKQHRPMPKPLSDIKTEPISESDEIQTPKENEAPQVIGEETTEVETPSRSEEQFETPLQKHPYKLTVTLDEDEFKKSTPGHETAAALKANQRATDEKGSPTDFHSMFHPAPLINNLPMEGHSTSNEEENSNVNIESPPEDKSEWQSMNQRNKSNYMKQQHYQPNYYNNKYRNKNRR